MHRLSLDWPRSPGAVKNCSGVCVKRQTLLTGARRGERLYNKAMKTIQGYYFIKPEDLEWRPSNLMKILNADYLERTGSENSARACDAAEKREHAAQAHSLGGILFRSRRHGSHAHRRRNVDGAEIRRRAGRARPVAPGVQRYRCRSAVAHRRRTEELEFFQGSKSKMDLSLIYPVDPKQLPKELAGVEWPPKGLDRG